MAGHSARPRFYVILSNISKIENLKKVMVSANAFGVAEVFVVGLPQVELGSMCAKAFGRHQPPALGTSFPAGSDVVGSLAVPPIQFRRFESLTACREHCQSIGCSVCGVEILESAEDLNAEPFRGDTAFMLGNEVRAHTARRSLHTSQHSAGTSYRCSMMSTPLRRPVFKPAI